MPTFKQSDEWTEYKGKKACRARSKGRCEAQIPGVCTGKHEQTHHRKNRSQLGSWHPNNLLGLCFACHHFVTDHPPEAHAMGLTLWSWEEITPFVRVGTIVTT